MASIPDMADAARGQAARSLNPAASSSRPGTPSRHLPGLNLNPAVLTRPLRTGTGADRDVRGRRNGVPNDIGRQIMQRRIRRCMTRDVLAGLIGRSTEWLRQVETGSRTLDSIHIAARLGDILGEDLYAIIVHLPPTRDP